MFKKKGVLKRCSFFLLLFLEQYSRSDNVNSKPGMLVIKFTG
jgi:hypothetical protein